MTRLMEIQVTRDQAIDLVVVSGEVDLSNIADLDDAIIRALAHETPSCLLDLSAVSFLDSTVVRGLLRWQAEAQLSSHEALAVTTGHDTPTLRILTLAGVANALPLFTTRHAARTALLEGRRARDDRRLRWLTDAELATERTDAQAASDAATQRLQNVTDEEHRRSATDRNDPAP